MKKPIMIGIVIVCLALAVMITMKRRSGKNKYSLENMEYGQMTWVKCDDAKCNAAYQMDKKDYFVYLRENQDPMSMMAPAIACPSCGEEGGYRSEKFEKCGLVFERVSVINDFADRCPDCSFSKTEQKRKDRRKQ